jgi:hypothetical protein
MCVIISVLFLDYQRGDLYLLCRFLLAREDKRVYNMREKQFAKCLNRACGAPLADMIADLDKGDMSQTAKQVWLY